jgi:hypothetical protein
LKYISNTGIGTRLRTRIGDIQGEVIRERLREADLEENKTRSGDIPDLTNVASEFFLFLFLHRPSESLLGVGYYPVQLPAETEGIGGYQVLLDGAVKWTIFLFLFRNRKREGNKKTRPWSTTACYSSY